MDLVYYIETLGTVFHTHGYWIIFLGSLIESTPLGWVIPGGVILALGGFYSYSESLSLVVTLVSGFLGMFVSFIIAYFFGKKSGNYLIKKFHQEDYADKAKHLLTKHGPKILTTSMLANITRFWMAYIAGARDYNFYKFTFYASIASLTWVSLVVTAGFLAGSQKGNLEFYLAKIGVVGFILFLIALGTVIYFIKKEFKINTDEDDK